MKRIGIKGTIIPNDYKEFYDWFGIESTCPNDVKTGITEADGDDIVFEVNSGGGSIFAGSEIYHAILTMTGSAASVIACAAESCIAPTGMLMIHNVSSGVRGDHQAFEHEAAVLRECDQAIAAAYVAKTGMERDALLQMMNEETWINAERAVELGFVDEIAQAPGLYNGFCEILTTEQINRARNALGGRAVEAERLKILRLEGKHE